MFIYSRHDGRALTLTREEDVALDFFYDLDHVYLLRGDDVADIGVDDCVLLEYLLVFEVYGLLPLVLSVVVKGLKAEVLAVVDDICVLTDYDPLAGLELIDSDLVMVEEILLVLFQLQEILRVRGRYLLDVFRVSVLYP